MVQKKSKMTKSSIQRWGGGGAALLLPFFLKQKEQKHHSSVAIVCLCPFFCYSVHVRRRNSGSCEAESNDITYTLKPFSDYTKSIDNKFTRKWLVGSFYLFIFLFQMSSVSLSVFFLLTISTHNAIDEFLITWWPWKQVQLDGHLNWLHFATSGYEGLKISFNASACTIVQRSKGIKL